MTDDDSPRYLIWSPRLRTWRGPSTLGPRTSRLAEAGRYLIGEAREAINDLVHTPSGPVGDCDEILQLAPEHGGDLTTRDSRFAIQEGTPA